MPRKIYTAGELKKKIDEKGVDGLTLRELQAARKFSLTNEEPPAPVLGIGNVVQLPLKEFNLAQELAKLMPAVLGRLSALAMHGEDTPSVQACKELRTWHGEQIGVTTVRPVVVFDPIGDLDDLKRAPAEPKTGTA